MKFYFLTLCILLLTITGVWAVPPPPRPTSHSVTLQLINTDFVTIRARSDGFPPNSYLDYFIKQVITPLNKGQSVDLKKISSLIEFIENRLRLLENNGLQHRVQDGSPIPYNYKKVLLDIALSPKISQADLQVKAVTTLIKGIISKQDPRILSPLTKALIDYAHTPPSVRKAIALGFAKVRYQDTSILGALSHSLSHDPKFFVRRASAFALGEINPKDPIYRHRLGHVAFYDTHSRVSQEAISSLMKMGGAKPPCPKAFSPTIN